MNLNELQKDQSSLDSYTRHDSMGHYSVPPAYFECLSSSIMEQVDRAATSQDHKVVEAVALRKAPSLFVKLKPILFLAASFLTIFFSFKVMLFVRDYYIDLEAKAVTISPNDELYLKYYEDYAMRVIYNEEEHLLDEVQYNF